VRSTQPTKRQPTTKYERFHELLLVDDDSLSIVNAHESSERHVRIHASHVRCRAAGEIVTASRAPRRARA
jgi:hypothetical protein